MSETTRTIVTRIQNKYDLASAWTENNPVLFVGELGYESDTGKFKIGDGKKNWNDLPYAAAQSTSGGSLDVTNDNLSNLQTKIEEVRLDLENIELLDTKIKLENDLYAYTSIGKITGASNTNPIRVASAGSSLKDVFNKVFGTQQDTQPNITTTGVSLSKTQDIMSAGGNEYGINVAAATPTITFTLNNSATAQYGYRCGDTKTTTSNATFKYAITKQNNADIKITLPSDKTATVSMVTAGTCVSVSNNILYCNFNSNNQVSIKLTLDAGSTTTNSQIRYEAITGVVTLGEAQTSNGTKIDKFLTYLGNDATTTSYYLGGNKDATTSSYTISAGYVPYGYTLAAGLPSSLPTSGRSKSKPSSITVSGGNSSTYLYIFVPADNSDITSLTASGFDVPFSKISSSTSLVVNNNKSATYKVFKTNDPVKADTFKL